MKKYRLILGMILILLIVCAFSFLIDDLDGKISNGKIVTENGKIVVEWENDFLYYVDGIQITVHCDGDCIDVIDLPPTSESYEYSDGIHGKMYRFTVKSMHNGNPLNHKLDLSALFVEWEQIRDFPIMEFTTDSGNEPTYTPLYPAEGFAGRTITDNKYESGTVNFTKNGVTTQYQAGIKVRGNTSVPDPLPKITQKTPYKIKFDQNVNLFDLPEEDCGKKFVLLKCSDIKSIFGLWVAEIIQREWVPSFQFVNVVINGDFKGSYLLVEDPQEGIISHSVKSTGFFVENDPYFWNSDCYFQSKHQEYLILHENELSPKMQQIIIPMGYTVKYPPNRKTGFEEDLSQEIKKYIEQLESILYDRESMLEHIDLASFADWILVRDFTGEIDSGGANMYMYCADASADDWTVSMATAWDFNLSLYVENDWSWIHTVDLFYYRALFSRQEFCDVYARRWEEISAVIGTQLNERINLLEKEYSTAIQNSWDLDSARWGTPTVSFFDEIDVLKAKIKERTDWITDSIEKGDFLFPEPIGDFPDL